MSRKAYSIFNRNNDRLSSFNRFSKINTAVLYFFYDHKLDIRGPYRSYEAAEKAAKWHKRNEIYKKNRNMVELSIKKELDFKPSGKKEKLSLFKAGNKVLKRIMDIKKD